MPDTPIRQLSTRLDREWAHLTTRIAVVRRARSWAITDAPFGTLDELLALAGHRTTDAMDGPDPTAAARADELLGRLLALAPTEPIAARVVLQRILPGLMSIVRAEQRRDAGTDAMSELVAEAWVTITRPRSDALPSSDVAARLLNEARHRAFVRPRRRRRIAEEFGVDIDVAVPAHSSSFDEVVAVLAEARRGGLPAAHLDVVRGLLDHGTSRRLAAATGITARTVYNRKRDAVARIRRCALAIA
jgi:hypothetical protein